MAIVEQLFLRFAEREEKDEAEAVPFGWDGPRIAGDGEGWREEGGGERRLYVVSLG